MADHEARMVTLLVHSNPTPSASGIGTYPAPTMTALMTWLTPVSGTTRDQLTATIDRLAADHDAPRFQPHVTVLVTLDTVCDAAARRLASLAADMPPFELAFTAIGHEETYFRSLYLRAAPSAQLQALQEAGRQAFALDRLPPAPHLSLLYSDMAEDRKRPIIADLGVSLPLTVCFDAIELWGRDPRGVGSWYRAARVPLSGASRP
jgi:2'-5' RNA ligase